MKEKILTSCISFTFFIYSLVPVWLVILQGRLLGWLLHHVVRFKRKRILDNLELVYGQKEEWPPAILKKIYRHIGLLIAEFLKMPSLKGEKYNQRFHLHGEEHLCEKTP